MSNKFLDIFEYESEEDYNLWRGCKMLRDFGPLKKGEEFHDIQVDFHPEFTMSVFNTEGDTQHEFKFSLTAN